MLGFLLSQIRVLQILMVQIFINQPNSVQVLLSFEFYLQKLMECRFGPPKREGGRELIVLRVGSRTGCLLGRITNREEGERLVYLITSRKSQLQERELGFGLGKRLGFQSKSATRTVADRDGASVIGSTSGLQRLIRLGESFNLIYCSSSGSSRFGRKISLKFRRNQGFVIFS